MQPQLETPQQNSKKYKKNVTDTPSGGTSTLQTPNHKSLKKRVVKSATQPDQSGGSKLAEITAFVEQIKAQINHIEQIAPEGDDEKDDLARQLTEAAKLTMGKIEELADLTKKATDRIQQQAYQNQMIVSPRQKKDINLSMENDSGQVDENSEVASEEVKNMQKRIKENRLKIQNYKKERGRLQLEYQDLIPHEAKIDTLQNEIAFIQKQRFQLRQKADAQQMQNMQDELAMEKLQVPDDMKAKMDKTKTEIVQAKAHWKQMEKEYRGQQSKNRNEFGTVSNVFRQHHSLKREMSALSKSKERPLVKGRNKHNASSSIVTGPNSAKKPPVSAATSQKNPVQAINLRNFGGNQNSQNASLDNKVDQMQYLNLRMKTGIEIKKRTHQKKVQEFKKSSNLQQGEEVYLSAQIEEITKENDNLAQQIKEMRDAANPEDLKLIEEEVDPLTKKKTVVIRRRYDSKPPKEKQNDRKSRDKPIIKKNLVAISHRDSSKNSRNQSAHNQTTSSYGGASSKNSSTNKKKHSQSVANTKILNLQDSQGSIEEMIETPDNDINRADLNVESIKMNINNNSSKKPEPDDEDEIQEIISSN